MMPIRHPMRIGLLLALSIALLSCSPAPTLRIGSNPWPGYLALYHARDLGLFDGHPIRLVDFDNTEDVLRAFRNRAIDAAAVTLDEALHLAESGADLRIILVFSISHGADVVLARPGIDTPQQLRGRRLGVETNALGAYMLARLLEQAGLSSQDLTIVHVPLQEHEAAYRSGKVDAVITFDPQRSRLLAAGAREIFSSRALPGEVVDVLVVREETLRSHRTVLATLETAYFQALTQLQRDPQAAAGTLSRRIQIDSADLMAAWNLMELAEQPRQHILLGDGPGSLHHTMQRMQQVMQQAGLLSQPVLQSIRLGTAP
ncbi:ABC transporter substrate-binding protein [Sulfurivermis fontis]|uniref:ABC transporter substrate-binding protein n=1 Tax=Sulfurivermis fontis TaxID=1972068 RepID=UPI000FD78F5A|nr:ABC transporter substrate-binding protein [Sulfurivermis fontis]